MSQNVPFKACQQIKPDIVSNGQISAGMPQRCKQIVYTVLYQAAICMKFHPILV